jgi:hypothetical protein
MLMNTRLDSIPNTVPYLQADPAAAARWRDRVPADANNVGLVWAGRPTHANDRNRSIALEALAPLTESRGVRLFSLQKSIGANPTMPSSAFRGNLVDFTNELGDFADTAALIDNLDLVITVDTSIAHLAGAMGKRVWVLLPKIPDWRWGMSGESSPWYPTARLFRQPTRGDWQAVIQHVAQELQKLTVSPQ